MVFNRIPRVLLSAVLFAAAVTSQPADTKTSIAVLNMKAAAGITDSESDLLSDRLRIELFNTRVYNVMEREQMQTVLKEQGFQQSGACTDEGCMIEIGQLLGVRQLVTGSIGKLGKMYMVNLRSVDIQTGKILGVVSEDIKGDIEEVVERLNVIARRLAFKEPDPAVRQEQTRPVETVDEKPAEPARPADPGLFKCDNKIYLEYLELGTWVPNLKMTPKEFADLSNEVSDDLLDALNECFDDIVGMVTRAQLAAHPSCDPVIIRVNILNYNKKPSGSSQFAGTVDLELEFYENRSAATPAFKVKMSETGARHWGDYEPFENAMTEVGEEIADNLDDHDYIRKLQRRLR